MFRSSRRRMCFCIAQHWHRPIDLRDGDQAARRKERLRQRSMGLPATWHSCPRIEATPTCIQPDDQNCTDSSRPSAGVVSNFLGRVRTITRCRHLRSMMSSIPLSLHYRPTGRDIWGLIAPRTPNGRGGPNWFEGDAHCGGRTRSIRRHRSMASTPQPKVGCGWA